MKDADPSVIALTTKVENRGIACFDTDEELEKFWRNPIRKIRPIIRTTRRPKQ